MTTAADFRVGSHRSWTDMNGDVKKELSRYCLSPEYLPCKQNTMWQN